MLCSNRRREANRANAARSTGPRTEEGKARSRANSVRHGMTGAGVVLPADADAAKVEADAATLGRAMACATLGRRLAVLADRLDRLDRRERAATDDRIRRAAIAAEEERQSAVDALIGLLRTHPEIALRRLRTTPEGCDRLIRLWDELSDDLAEGRDWTLRHLARIELLEGRDPGDLRPSPIALLSDVARGSTRRLPPDELADDPNYHQAVVLRARERLIEIAGERVDDLLARRAELPAVDPEVARAEEADLALFDDSKRGELFRRYELDTERHLLRTLRAIERAEAAPAILPEPPGLPVASFGGAAAAPPPTAPGSPAAEPVPVSSVDHPPRSGPGAARRRRGGGHDPGDRGAGASDLAGSGGGGGVAARPRGSGAGG